MGKLARLTAVTNFLGTDNSTAYLTFNGILSNACQAPQKSFVTSFIYLPFKGKTRRVIFVL